MKGILIDSNRDPIISNGSMIVGDADNQIVESVLVSTRGEWKEFPLIGADAIGMLGGNPDVFWPSDTRKQIEACGVKIENIKVSSDGIITIS